MSLALGMVVRNGAARIRPCLSEIHGLFDEIVVIDTGSSDGTQDILRNEFHARIVDCAPAPEDPYSITAARNLMVGEARAPWMLVIDVDESISPEHVRQVRQRSGMGPDAFFLKWRNLRNGKVFDDYKLTVLRTDCGITFEGMVHSSPQPSLRRLGLSADLLDDIIINHSLDEQSEHRSKRTERLERYVEEYPTWWRYRWFLGYSYFRDGDFEKSIGVMKDLCNSLSEEFPVECLNSHIVLTDINARKQNHDKCFRIMKQAISFYEMVKGDFEVRANRDLKHWLYSTRAIIDEGRLDEIHAYEFAC